MSDLQAEIKELKIQKQQLKKSKWYDRINSFMWGLFLLSLICLIVSCMVFAFDGVNNTSIWMSASGGIGIVVSLVCIVINDKILRDPYENKINDIDREIEKLRRTK